MYLYSLKESAREFPVDSTEYIGRLAILYSNGGGMKSKSFWFIFLTALLSLEMGHASNLTNPKSTDLIEGNRYPLTYEQRVQAFDTLQRIKFSHRVPSLREDAPKPVYEQIFTNTVLYSRVSTMLRQCNALEVLWGKTFSGEDLQNEMNRMARNSLMPHRLAEIFAALDNDPHRIAECLARPILVENTIRSLFSGDERFQGAIHSRAEREWAGVHTLADLHRLTGYPAPQEWVLVTTPDEAAGKEPVPIEGPIYLDQDGWDRLQHELLDQMGMEGAGRQAPRPITAGMVSSLQENEFSYYGILIRESTDRKIAITRVVWEKEEFTGWWDQNESRFALEIKEPEYFYAVPDISLTNRVLRAGGDSWVPVTSSGAPVARTQHVAVWTGSDMIVWGGWNGSSYYRNGGKYNPATDSWTATTTTNAPVARRLHTGVWDSSEQVMYVWGGYGGASFNSGGVYDPNSNSWVSTCDTTGFPCYVPEGRYYHTMDPIGYLSSAAIWGGTDTDDMNTGGNLTYNGGTGTWWDATDTIDPDCPSPRAKHTSVNLYGWRYYMVWTMVIWGGDDRLNSGGILRLDSYSTDPSDFWKPITTSNAPKGRHNHAAIGVRLPDPTHDLMMVWGGYTWGADLWNREGGIYDAQSDVWTLMTTTNAPDGREHPTAVWTGHEMIVWGGDRSSSVYNTGGRYDYVNDLWYTTTTSGVGAPSARTEHTAVWADSGMIVWGGSNLTNALGNGSMYISCWDDPDLNYLIFTVEDADPCDNTGILVSWDPDSPEWADYGYSAGRSYMILRDGSPLGSGGCSGTIPYGTISCTDDSASPGVGYTYSMVVANSCNRSTQGLASSPVSDETSTAPTVTVTCNAEDADGCTASSGITVTWPRDPGGGWNDNGETGRKYRVWRWDSIFSSWQALGSQIDYGTTSYVDSTTITGISYRYRVRYINGCGKNAETPDTDVVQDFVQQDPVVSQSTTVSDADPCTYSGLTITWPQDPDSWGDGGTGDRYYRVRRSIDGVNFNPIWDNIPYPATSYVDTGASHDQPYYYQVRYKNGCGLDADSGNDSASDGAGVVPTVSVNSNSVDSDYCDDAGITVTWPQDPGDWGDSSHGTRTYDVLRNGSALAAGSGITYGTTEFVDTTGTNGTVYTYSVRYNNGCSLSSSTSGTSSSDKPFAPAAPDNNTAADVSPCLKNGVQVTWSANPPSSTWGDGGEGTRTYDVLRDGTPIQTGISLGTTSYTDSSGLQDQTYTYTVRYVNGCGISTTTSPGAQEADARDLTPCPIVGESLTLTRTDPLVQLDWNDPGCGDLDHYRVYAQSDCSAPFPVQWMTLSTPGTSSTTDALNSSNACYKIVTVDSCNNESN